MKTPNTPTIKKWLTDSATDQTKGIWHHRFNMIALELIELRERGDHDNSNNISRPTGRSGVRYSSDIPK